jgi:hypothetical protein
MRNYTESCTSGRWRATAYRGKTAPTKLTRYCYEYVPHTHGRSELRQGKQMTDVHSFWTLVSIERATGKPHPQLMFGKTHIELEMELLARKNPGVYSHFVCIETREDERPIIHVFESEKAA